LALFKCYRIIAPKSHDSTDVVFLPLVMTILCMGTG